MIRPGLETAFSETPTALRRATPKPEFCVPVRGSSQSACSLPSCANSPGEDDGGDFPPSSDYNEFLSTRREARPAGFPRACIPESKQPPRAGSPGIVQATCPVRLLRVLRHNTPRATGRNIDYRRELIVQDYILPSLADEKARKSGQVLSGNILEEVAPWPGNTSSCEMAAISSETPAFHWIR